MGGSESKGREGDGEAKESSDTTLAKESSGTALAVGAIAGAAILALGVGVVSLMGGSSKPSEEKTMKAPGRDERIPRDPFEEDPATYFRNLRRDRPGVVSLMGDLSKPSEEKTMKAPGRDERIPRNPFLNLRHDQRKY